MRQRLTTFRDQQQLRREPGGAAGPSLSYDDAPVDTSGSWLFLALVAVGAAAMALGLLWVWQSWSQRSDPPIDDLLPVLVEASEDDVEVDPVEVEPTTADPAAAAVENASDTASQPAPTPVPVDIVVHVSGAVLAAGVVALPPGSRVFEAVELAGGALDEADLDRVNLAAPLVDGERIHVPAVGEGDPPELVEPQRPPPAAAPTSGDDASRDAPPEVVDLNLATVELLQTLPGVGPSTADAIAATRNERGPFRSVDELLEVPGIGETKLAQLRPFVAVDSLGLISPP